MRTVYNELESLGISKRTEGIYLANTSYPAPAARKEKETRLAMGARLPLLHRRSRRGRAVRIKLAHRQESGGKSRRWPPHGEGQIDDHDHGRRYARG